MNAATITIKNVNFANQLLNHNSRMINIENN